MKESRALSFKASPLNLPLSSNLQQKRLSCKYGPHRRLKQETNQKLRKVKKKRKKNCDTEEEISYFLNVDLDFVLELPQLSIKCHSFLLFTV